MFEFLVAAWSLPLPKEVEVEAEEQDEPTQDMLMLLMADDDGMVDKREEAQ